MIVKQEKTGFGFTLSSDMPVFVNKVFNGSSAHRAGILEGDRIMKVCVCVCVHPSLAIVVGYPLHNLTIYLYFVGTNSTCYQQVVVTGTGQWDRCCRPQT